MKKLLNYAKKQRKVYKKIFLSEKNKLNNQSIVWEREELLYIKGKIEAFDEIIKFLKKTKN